ncbi:MAG TPA: HDOD domain-containing protein [Kofleriaceae bacterium]|nr:HDOD domain-containing protein [Kofleriaceae bacterium]
MTRRILFVDDDAQLLTGLSKALRKHRDRWTMAFAGSGEAALAEVKQHGFDVVVSDMRMPGMDGAALLAGVREHDPTTIRMILSGFADGSAIVRALPVAHQFFNKPCDLRELSGAIDRACDLRAMFDSASLRAVIGKLDALPSAPGVYHELAAQIGRADTRVEAVAAVVERDVALCARVLQVASSAFFGSDRPMRSIVEAVACIGIEMVGGLALASHALGASGDRLPPEFSLAELQHHSLMVARTARELAGAAAASDAFIAGLVHDIGEIIIATALPDAHAAITTEQRGSGDTRCAVEHRLLGTSHAELGAYLLGLWGLPLTIIDAVAHHHDEVVAPTPVAAALHAAHLTTAPGRC